MEGAAVIDGIEYIGDGEFVVTADKMLELLEAQIVAQVANSLGVEAFDGWDTTLEEWYPQYSDPTPFIIADSIVSEMIGDE